ncbi:class C sortase [Dubosiella newyorkensis]|uniref:class C sortase n=1 Tax=Dubosiella newyorkensis TaxID=1862672 RepID=UPI00248BB00E|nr:class C sortase [Dubosiella newyorkensis]
MKKFIKKNWSTILLVMMFTVGLSLLLYPSIADWWNKFHATRAIDSYTETVASMSDEEYQKYLSEAKLYNSELLLEPNRFHPSDTLHSMYESTLNVSGDGIIGVVKIPSLRVNLPIYHGVEESTLQDAIGHIEGSSLPIGGPSTHTIVSGHRGLPSAKLFTDLDQLEVGDYFMFQVLDDTYTYQVDQIKIVEPNDFTYLQIEEGKDLATLQTCTPYGINTHRLLVRGHRVDNLPDDFVNARSEAILIDRNLVALFIGVLIFVVMGVVLGIRNVLNKRVGKDK